MCWEVPYHVVGVLPSALEDLQEHQLAVERRWEASVGLHFAHFEGKYGQSHSLHSVEGHR